MATAQVADLVTTMRADTAKFDKDIDKTKQRLRGYTTDAKKSTKQNDSLSNSFKSAAGNAAMLPGPLGNIAGQVDGLSGTITSLGTAWGVMGGSAAVAIGTISKGLPILAETERRLLQQEQLLKSTGYASGYTAEQLDKMARQLALSTLTSTQEASKAIGVMLTFRSVSEDTLKRAVFLSQDLASVLGGDVTSAAKQLGKALEMPTVGVTALRESGISFTVAQRDMIKEMEESGRVAEAQRFILEELDRQIGGAAGAEAGGLIGTFDTFGQSVEEAYEAMAKWSGAAPMVKHVVAELADGLFAVRDIFAPSNTNESLDLMSEQVKLIQKIKSELKSAGGYDKLPSLNPLGYSKNEYKNDQRRLSEIGDRLAVLREERNKRVQEENEASQKAAKAEAEREKQRLADKKAAEEKADKDKQAKEQKRQSEKDARDKAAADKAIEREKTQTESWLQEVNRRNMGEMQLIETKFSDDLARLEGSYSKKLISEEQYQQALMDIQQHYDQERMELVDKQLAEQEEKNKGFWDRYYESMQKSADGTDELWRQTFDSFSTQFGNAFASAVMQSESVGDAFSNMAKGMAQSMIAALGKIMAQRMVMWALEKTLLKGQVGGEVARVTSEAQSASIISGINAFKSTAAIPIIGPALAPGAMTAALAVTEPMAVAATAAASSGFAGMFDNGGYIPAGQWGVTGEYGPEITLGPSHVIGRKNTMSMLEGASGDSAQPNVAVSVYEAPAGTYVNTKWSPEDRQMVVDIMCKDADSNGNHFSYIQSKLGVKAGGYK